MRKLLILLIFLISVITFAENNPLEKYISDKVYNNGISKFPKNKDIFRTKVYSMAAIKKEIEEARNKMRASFKEVTFIFKQDEKWVSTFYYIDEKGVKKRKTVVEREKMSIGNKSYLVLAYEKGIKIIDLRTKVELLIEKKGR